MTNLFWDTNLFIYLFDATGPWHDMAHSLRTGMLKRGYGIVTSTMTLGELQVGPRKHGSTELAIRYKKALFEVASVLSFDEASAERYAELRATSSLKGPDAIQLACAAARGVELFVTNDERLHKIRVPGIHFIVPIQTALHLVG